MRKIIFILGSIIWLVTGLFTVYANSLGDSWIQSNISAGNINSVYCSSSFCLAVYGGGAYRSVDNGSTWNSTYSADSATSVSCSGNTCILVTGNSGIKKSTDGGVTWSSSSLSSGTGRKAAYCGTSFCMAGVGSALYRSTDGGANWSSISWLPSDIYQTVSCYLNNCVTSSQSNFTYASNNGGVNWGYSNIYYGEGRGSYCTSGFCLMAFGNGNGIKKSTDGGVTWSATTTPATIYQSVSCSSDNSICFAGSGPGGNNGIIYSIDNGSTWTTSSSKNSGEFPGMYCDQSVCVAGSTGSGIFYTNSSFIPQPLTTEINGLICDTDWIPSLSGATWYDFGELTNMFDGSTSNKIAWANYSSDYADFDTIVWEPSGSGSSMGSGTFQYPATQTGYLYDGDEIGTLGITSTRSGIPTDFNLFQFFGTQNISFGLAGRALLNDTNGVQYGYIQLTSSGGVITGGLANTNSAIKTLGIQLMTRFRGFRIGKGQLEEKTSCSINFNQCQWSFEGNSLACVPVSTISGLQFEGNGAGCGITGSGSIYGSGACVPLTNASGSIIPPPPITGGFVTYDGSGNVVGTVAPTIDPESEFGDLWTCGDDPWYKCPFTIIRKLWNYTFTGASKAQNTVNQLEQATTQSMSGTEAGSSITGSTYTGSNMLIQGLVSVDDRVGESEGINRIKWVAIFVVLFCFILALVLLIK